MNLNEKLHAAKLRVLHAAEEYWYADGATDEHNELVEAVADMVRLQAELKDAENLLLQHVHK